MKQLILLFLTLFSLAAFSSQAEQTLAIIKPDAVRDGHIGEIITVYEKNGLRIAAIKKVQLTPLQARSFYHVHSELPFFSELTKFMSSGPIVALVLEGDNAIMKNRELMGATDPKDAANESIRARFGKNKGENAVHGSDSPMSAIEEIQFFFSPSEIL